jgi:5-methylcytosine-specific restriction endonuclease McrA
VKYTKEKMRLYMKEYRTLIIADAKLFLGGTCKHCGSKENLEFDHIVPSEKRVAIGKIYTSTRITLYTELLKCQLLCKNCHLKKTRIEISKRIPRNNRKWKHGTLTGYVSKSCRCIECKSNYSIYRHNKRLTK